MGTALQNIDEVPNTITSVRATGLLRPLANPADVVAVQNETRALIAQALKEDRDFGTIPGTNKPSLLKPGAERLALGFGLTPRFSIVETEIDHDRKFEFVKRKKVWKNEYKDDKRFDWLEETGVSIGLYRYVMNCDMIHRDSGVVVASCIGSCSSMESKYIDRPRDVENTIIKMAEKRALIGAVLLALGLSDEFTQDTEDLAANGVLGDNTDAPKPARSGNSKAESKKPKSAAEKIMPFGKSKGKPLGEMSNEDLSSTVNWCREKDSTKFKDLIDACQDVLRERYEEDLDNESEMPDVLQDNEDDLPF